MVNGYGYAFGNPLVLHDVTGNWPSCDELWGLCDSPTFFWNEVVGFGQGAVGTVDAMVHPLRTHRLMVDACNAGFDQWSGGAGLTWEGGAQCVDNLNPFAQIRRDASSSLRSGCVEESGQAFGRALFGAAATAAPFVKAAPAAIDGARNGAGWWNRTNTGLSAANTTATSGRIRSPLWTATKSDSAAANALRHFNDHGADFPGVKNSLEYVAEAQTFLRLPPSGTRTRLRTNGDVVRYNPGSNTFGVMDSSGAPRTYIRPNPAQHGLPTNLDYFNAQ